MDQHRKEQTGDPEPGALIYPRLLEQDEEAPLSGFDPDRAAREAAEHAQRMADL